jgi:hypothetical protein
MPPDGEIVLIGLPKKINARAWLPATVKTAATLIDDWRAQSAMRISPSAPARSRFRSMHSAI